MTEPRMTHHVGDDFLRQLGNIVVCFSILEETVEFFLMSLINEPQRVGRALTTEMPFKNLRAGIVSLVLEKHGRGNDFDRIKLLLNRAGKAEEERNRMFHSEWGVDECDDSVVYRSKETAKEKHGLRGEGREYTVADLEAFGNSLLDLSADFGKLLENFCERGLANDSRPVVPYGNASIPDDEGNAT